MVVQFVFILERPIVQFFLGTFDLCTANFCCVIFFGKAFFLQMHRHNTKG